MTDLSTRALYDRGRIYVPPASNSNAQSQSHAHDPGRLEARWESKVRAKRTGLCFSEWLREKGWR
jgi:hypothetical protein